MRAKNKHDSAFIEIQRYGAAGDAVIIPDGVTSIADDAFDAGTVIIGEANGYI